jgi:hypothetical protein
MDAVLDDDGIEAVRDNAPPGLFLSRRGAWYHDGDRVKHAGLEGLLHRSIARDDAGKLLVTTGRDKLPFVAEDAPYFIRTLVDGRLLLSDGSVDDPRHLCIDDEGRIRASVKGGAFWALASRGAAQGLAALVDGDGCIRLAAGVLALTPQTVRDWSEVPAFAINEA